MVHSGSLSKNAYCVIAVVLVLSSTARSQTSNDIVTNGRTGSIKEMVDLSSEEDIDAGLYGTANGRNLYLGFDRFSIGMQREVNLVAGSLPLSDLNQIDNVIAFVDGGDPSNLQGHLGVEGIGEDHFFFLNPNGIIFGSSATVSTNASFHVSTAEELVFDNGDILSTVSPTTSILSSANPGAFGFLGNTPASIDVSASSLRFVGESTVTFAGGSLSFQGSQVYAPGGTLRLIAVRSSGELDGLVGKGQLDTSGFSAFGPISVEGGSRLSVSGYEPQEFSNRPLLGVDRVGILKGYGCIFECLLELVPVSDDDLNPQDVLLHRDDGSLVEESPGKPWVLRPLERPGGEVQIRAGAMRLADSNIRSRSFGSDPGVVNVDIDGDLSIIASPMAEEDVGLLARADVTRIDFVNPEPYGIRLLDA